MTRLSGENIHTHWIADAIGVTMPVALRVQEEINSYYNLDWSEATEKEIKKVSKDAFESLNKVHKF